ncbi:MULTISPECIES: LacI family DNA-binding transcriptional regulator [unclassified Luteococcus]|uniref:LacI family DNA-binding transcriptional regulator n=1 Tax=unclassified Luteococcus TaxID=2639923 RepID=UPI00313EC757
MSTRQAGVTIYQVAQRAGVSTATVSRALRDDPRISDATKLSVREAAQQLDYLPKAAARALAGSRTNALGLVLPHIDGPYYADLLVGFETAASAQNLSVIITLANPRQDCRTAVRTLAAQVDGLAFMARSAANSQLIADIARTRPVVTAARPQVPGSDAFFVENASTADRLTQHLIDGGRRRLAFVGNPERGSDLGMRHDGFVAAVSRADLEPTTYPIFPSEQDGRAFAERLLADGFTHDALVCGNDELALAVMQTLQRGGVAVPADVAITGWDDTVTARYVEPGLTSISQPVRQLGGLVVSRLAQRIAGDGPREEAVTLPATLAHRTSCGCSTFHSIKELP